MIPRLTRVESRDNNLASVRRIQELRLSHRIYRRPSQKSASNVVVPSRDCHTAFHALKLDHMRCKCKVRP